MSIESTGATRRRMDKTRGHKYYEEPGYVSEEESRNMWKEREKRIRELAKRMEIK